MLSVVMGLEPEEMRKAAQAPQQPVVQRPPRRVSIKPWKKPANYWNMARQDVERGYVDLFGEARAPEWDGFHWSPSAHTLADEIRLLRSWVKRNDRDPLSTLTAKHLPEQRCPIDFAKPPSNAYVAWPVRLQYK